MRMMSPEAVPRMKTIGILSGCAIVLFIVAAWVVIGGGKD